MPGPGAPGSAVGAGAGAGVICSAVAGAGPGVAFFGVAFFGGVAFLGPAVFPRAAVRLSPAAVVPRRVRAVARLCSGRVVWLSFSAAIELSSGVLVWLSPGALGWLWSGMAGRRSPGMLVALSPGVLVALAPGVALGKVVCLRGVAFLAVFRLGDAGVSGCAASVSAAGVGDAVELTGVGGVALELTGPVGSAAPGVTGATVPTGRPGCSTGVPSPSPRWSVASVPVVAALVAAVSLSVPLVDPGATGVLPVVACLVDRLVCCPAGAWQAVEALRFRARSAAGVSAVTCPVISCSPAAPPAAVPPLGLAPALARPVGTSAGSVPPGSVGVPALADAFLAGRGWRGSGCSGVGGWNRTAGAAFAGRRFPGAASVPSSWPGPAALGGAGGGVKVAFGERRRAPSAGSRRGGSLGVCSCMSMERSRERDGAHGENTSLR
ncbi:hypothetical protein [Micromonospora sp. 4G55]|uniref:hypothetical protein n=1 Tax=Micromonospora sp. 4G55 TaxID=2806102 RepID=UPI001A6249CB|nr:hypothetical protein [Micromonospora sp. 4G55]MBM0258442.1 hypothetical protein [Micromonospora sp. 4G55]